MLANYCWTQMKPSTRSVSIPDLIILRILIAYLKNTATARPWSIAAGTRKKQPLTGQIKSRRISFYQPAKIYPMHPNQSIMQLSSCIHKNSPVQETQLFVRPYKLMR